MFRTILTVAATAMALAFAPTMPAYATDARTAVRLCDKNPNCDYTVNGNGSIDLRVNGNSIWCPQDGECVCDLCNPPQKRKGEGPKGRVPVATILQGKT